MLGTLATLRNRFLLPGTGCRETGEHGGERNAEDDENRLQHERWIHRMHGVKADIDDGAPPRCHTTGRPGSTAATEATKLTRTASANRKRRVIAPYYALLPYAAIRLDLFSNGVWILLERLSSLYSESITAVPDVVPTLATDVAL